MVRALSKRFSPSTHDGRVLKLRHQGCRIVLTFDSEPHGLRRLQVGGLSLTEQEEWRSTLVRGEKAGWIRIRLRTSWEKLSPFGDIHMTGHSSFDEAYLVSYACPPDALARLLGTSAARETYHQLFSHNATSIDLLGIDSSVDVTFGAGAVPGLTWLTRMIEKLVYSVHHLPTYTQ